MTKKVLPPLPLPEKLHQIIRFDGESGKYYWLPRDGSMFGKGSANKRQGYACGWNKQFSNTEVFLSKEANGYRKVAIFERTMLAHRVIWAFHYGEWPQSFIDHINGVRDDNRLENLRLVSPVLNSRNKCMNRKNTSGVTGVTWHKRIGKWQAIIGRVYLGCFDDLAVAAAVRKSAETSLGYIVRPTP